MEKNQLTREEFARYIDISNDLEAQIRRFGIAGATYLLAGNMEAAREEARLLLEAQDALQELNADYFPQEAE